MSNRRIDIGNFPDILVRRSHQESTGCLCGKSVAIDPKWKPLFAVLIILGLIGLGAAGCGITGIGAQQHWWSAGLIDQLNQTYSLILICGGILGTGFLIGGIVGLVKIYPKKIEPLTSYSTPTPSDSVPKVNTSVQKLEGEQTTASHHATTHTLQALNDDVPKVERGDQKLEEGHPIPSNAHPMLSGTPNTVKLASEYKKGFDSVRAAGEVLNSREQITNSDSALGNSSPAFSVDNCYNISDPAFTPNKGVLNHKNLLLGSLSEESLNNSGINVQKAGQKSTNDPIANNVKSDVYTLAGAAATTSARKIKSEKKETTNCKGQICITTQTGGYVGHPSKRQLLPFYLTDMTLEDGSPLPLDAEDFFCELYLFNMSPQLMNSGIPSTMYLSGALFKGKKDGDSIRLKYKDKLIELTIQQQNHGLKFAKGNFEDVFALQTVYIKEACDLINPLFGIYDPYWFYRLGDKGAVYKLEIHKSEKDLTISHLKDGISEDFRPKVNPIKAPGNIHRSEDKTELIFVMEFCRFHPQDFDIILNETHLIIYGQFENRPLPCGPVDLNLADIKHMDGSLEEWEKALSCSREAMFACRWDKMPFFKGRSIEEMKTLMKKSSLLLMNGILKLNIPLL